MAGKELTATTARINFDLVYAWIADAQVLPATIDTYKKGVRRFKEFCETHYVTVPTRGDMLTYREYLNQRYSPRTCNLYLTVARRFLTFLHRVGLLPENVGDGLKGYKVDCEVHAKSAFTSSNIRRILAALDTSTLAGKRNKAILALMATCGLRCVEVVRATVGDLKIEGGVLRLHVQGKGKLDKTAAVNVPENVYQLIQNYLDARGGVSVDLPLFASLSHNNSGGAMSTAAVSKICKDAFKQAGFDSPDLTAHSLRHTAATLSISAGASLREVKQLLRHKNISTTEIYLHDLDALQNRAACLAADAIFGRRD